MMVPATYSKAHCIKRAKAHEKDTRRWTKQGKLWMAGISASIAAELRRAAEDGRA